MEKTSRTSTNTNIATTSTIKRGPWTPQEDKKLSAYIQQHGHGSWRSLPERAGLQRCGKSCRLRWKNYLSPDIKRGHFSLKEDQTIIQLHALLGNRWSAMAANLPGRTDNEIKNYWNTHLKKRLAKIGFDPVTHKPFTSILGGGDPKSLSKLSHIAQWESARLQAEARFVRESNLLKHAPPPQQCNDHFSLKTWETLMMPQPLVSNPSFEVTHGYVNESNDGHFEAPPLTSLAAPVVNSDVPYESGIGDCGDHEILEALLGQQSFNETGSFGLGDYWGWEQCDHISLDSRNVVMSEEMTNLFMFP